MPTFVGTSGWQYKHWRRRFYPAGLATDRWLERYAESFATVELNNSFYRLPPRATFVEWARRTPEDFLFAVKASRYLTHVRRLRDPEPAVERLMEAASGLGPKLAVILLQLPPSLTCQPERLEETLAAFPAGVRVAVELRHRSWFTEDVRDLLARHRAALCLADSRYRRTPLWRTADWTYLRLHQGRSAPAPCYGVAAIDGWVRRLADGWPEPSDRFVYFNNDWRGCAVRDAAVAVRRLEAKGLAPTRGPVASEIEVG